MFVKFVMFFCLCFILSACTPRKYERPAPTNRHVTEQKMNQTIRNIERKKNIQQHHHVDKNLNKFGTAAQHNSEVHKKKKINNKMNNTIREMKRKEHPNKKHQVDDKLSNLKQAIEQKKKERKQYETEQKMNDVILKMQRKKNMAY